MQIQLKREPFMPWVNLLMEDGSSLELDAEEAREWFKVHGANMDAVEKAMDDVWNFYGTEHIDAHGRKFGMPIFVKIHNPVLPQKSPLDPKL